MASQALEQILENVPKAGQARRYETIDLYTIGTTVLYTPDPRPMDQPWDYGPANMPGGPSNAFGLPPEPCYEPPAFRNESNFGLQGQQPFQGGYDLPGTGTQLHLHGPDNNTITYGTIERYGAPPDEKPLVELDGFRSAMASLIAERLDFKKFDR